MASQEEILFVRVTRLIDENKYEEAIGVTYELIELSPDLPDAYVKLAIAHFAIADSLQYELLERENRQSHIEEGISALTKTIDLLVYKYHSIRSQIPDYDSNLARFYSHRASAKMDLAKLIHFMPTQQDIPDILHDYKKALEYDENNVMAYREIGQIYENYLDEPDLAIEQFSKAIDIDLHPLDYLHRAWCNYCAGNTKEARSDYQKAVRLDSSIRENPLISPATIYNNEKKRLWREFLDEVQ